MNDHPRMARKIAPGSDAPTEQTTTVFVRKLARALSTPGIHESLVFRGPNAAKVFSYSADPRDPGKILRKSFDGTRTTGQLVDGKFRASKG
ncbi:hypothetical protein [Variovorax rhizosphaerae]|uniref:Uncharacterized protein n=1 Tax=Variovorax rhizosphaerae TaxID=1836200 RepID=A0ABU8WTF3_9BURK